MQITKLSTLTEGYDIEMQSAVSRSAAYKALLLELLAVIHRDGGQYTTLAGLMTSLQTAHNSVNELRRKNAALTARIGQLSRGEQ